MFDDRRHGGALLMAKPPLFYWRWNEDTWREAVDLAQGVLELDAAKEYGLVEGGPELDVERALEIIEAAEIRGIVPSPGAGVRFMATLAGYKTRARVL